jgi:hypothetical protein
MEATVRLENLTDGQSEVLADSIIVFRDEGTRVITHNFWTDTPIQPQTEYRLAVEHPDGKRTAATTTTPPSTPAVVSPESGNCLTSFTVQFPSIEDDRLVRAVVELSYSSGDSTGTTLGYSQTKDITVGEAGNVSFQFEPEQLLGRTFDSINDETEECYYTPLCANLTTGRITIRYTYLAPDWSERNPGDSTGLDPTESPFIENGKGFFGALWRDEVTTRVDTSDRIYIGGRTCPSPGS